MNKREIGGEREQDAAVYLERRGMRILARNFRCRIGEIDLIALDEGVLVFVEVKYRRSDRFGWGEEHVDKRKQQTIAKVARYYLAGLHGPLPPCRFDVVAIDGDGVTVHFENAFEA